MERRDPLKPRGEPVAKHDRPPITSSSNRPGDINIENVYFENMSPHRLLPSAPVNPKTHMSTLRPSTLDLPPSRPAPNLLPRLKDQSKEFAYLDSILQNKLALERRDGYRMFGAGGLGRPYVKGGDDLEPHVLRERLMGVHDAEVDMSSLRNRYPDPPLSPYGQSNKEKTEESAQAHDDFIESRMKYVQLASKRLQAVLGLRNDMPFDLPEVRRPNNNQPVFRGPSGRLDAGTAARHVARSGLSVDNPFLRDSRPSPRGFDIFSTERLGFGSPISIPPPTVDRNTGRGLREWLLNMGKVHEMRKRECRSISFHDFKPEMMSTAWTNELLAHYVAPETGDLDHRMDVYEIDLPTVMVDPVTKIPSQTIQIWIWFLIARPFMTHSPTDTSTAPPEVVSSMIIDSEMVDLSKSYAPPATNLSQEAVEVDPPTEIEPPPNFPSPTPLSWLVFACPISHITTYPVVTENIDLPSTSSTQERETENENSFIKTLTNRGQKVQKRTDYDFSHQGLPFFEFSSAKDFGSGVEGGPDAEKLGMREPLNFLSVEGIGGWYEEDEFMDMSREEYSRELAAWFDKGTAVNNEPPCPYRGVWWKKFYEEVYKDCRKWKKIKETMGRGKCRIVVRWDEYETDQHDEDVDMEGVAGPSRVGLKLKGGLGLAAKRDGGRGYGRMTRSELRRSLLGGGAEGAGNLPRAGMSGSGVLADPIRNRSVSGREKDLAAGKSDKGKIKKR